MKTILIIFCSLQVLTGTVLYFSVNPVHALIALILLFFEAAVIMATLNFEFMASLYILIYASAVAILFLFVIMMLELKFKDLPDLMIKPFTLSFILVWVIFLISFFTPSFYLNHYNPPCSRSYNWSSFGPYYTDIVTFSQLLYNNASLCFLLAGVILLMSLLGAVLLTANSEKNFKIFISKEKGRNSNTSSFFK